MSQELIQRWAIAIAITLGIWLIGSMTPRYGLGWLAKVSRRTSTDLDELLLDALRPYVQFWFLLLGLLVGIRFADPTFPSAGFVDRVALAVFLFSVTLALSSFLTRLVEKRAKRWPDALPTTTLTRNVVRIVVIGLGLMVVLGNLGIAIAPLLTALGVGSLAVALALQPTLSNLFAGFHVTLARKIRVGDFVELETGQQGYVVDIGWRSTQIRELPNNLVIVPNARIAEIIVRNFALPEAPQAALVQVGVAYGSDLEEVERVTVSTAREIQQKIPGADEAFEPFIRFHTFGDSAITFTVILRVKEFVDRYLVTHEFMKRLHRRYAEAGIAIPFPQRVLHLPEGHSRISDQWVAPGPSSR